MAGSICAILNIVVVIATRVGVLQAVGLWGDVVRLWRNLTSQGFALISLWDMGVEEVRSQKPEWRWRTRLRVG